MTERINAHHQGWAQFCITRNFEPSSRAVRRVQRRDPQSSIPR